MTTVLLVLVAGLVGVVGGMIIARRWSDLGRWPGGGPAHSVEAPLEPEPTSLPDDDGLVGSWSDDLADARLELRAREQELRTREQELGTRERDVERRERGPVRTDRTTRQPEPEPDVADTDDVAATARCVEALLDLNKVLSSSSQRFKIKTTLLAIGLDAIEPVAGERIDYDKHYVMDVQPTERPELDGTVAEVIRTGFIQAGMVRAPAEVIANKAADTTTGNKGDRA